MGNANIKFTGKGGPFTVYGPVSGKRYRYSQREPFLVVDERETAFFLGIKGQGGFQFERVVETPPAPEEPLVTQAVMEESTELPKSDDILLVPQTVSDPQPEVSTEPDATAQTENPEAPAQTDAAPEAQAATVEPDATTLTDVVETQAFTDTPAQTDVIDATAQTEETASKEAEDAPPVPGRKSGKKN